MPGVASIPGADSRTEPIKPEPEPDPADRSAEQEVPVENVVTGADLLPEELAVGSADSRAQAAAILLESEERTRDPDAGS